jgi:hypothetical protein
MRSETLSDFKRAGSILERVTARTIPMGQRARKRALNTIRYGRISKPKQLKKRTRRKHKTRLYRKIPTRFADKKAKQRMAHARHFLGKRRGRSKN